MDYDDDDEDDDGDPLADLISAGRIQSTASSSYVPSVVKHLHDHARSVPRATLLLYLSAHPDNHQDLIDRIRSGTASVADVSKARDLVAELCDCSSCTKTVLKPWAPPSWIFQKKAKKPIFGAGFSCPDCGLSLVRLAPECSCGTEIDWSSSFDDLMDDITAEAARNAAKQAAVMAQVAARAQPASRVRPEPFRCDICSRSDPHKHCKHCGSDKHEFCND